MTRRFPLLAVTALALVVAAAACSSGGGGGGNGPGSTVLGGMGPGAVDTSANVVAYASIASAPKVFLLTAGPAVALGIGSSSCPVKTVNGNTTTYTGGCTTPDGTTYAGSVVEQGGSLAGGNFTYQDWSISTVTSCGGVGYPTRTTLNGTFSLGGLTQLSFQSDVRLDALGVTSGGCLASRLVSAWSYSGTIASVSSSENIWSGSGAVGLTSGNLPGFPSGKVSASTTNEDVKSSQCQNEALSGSTTISGSGHNSTITYDGATDCKQVSDAQWSLDGTPKGVLDGVGCEVAPGSTGSGTVLLFGAGVALLLLRKRR